MLLVGRAVAVMHTPGRIVSWAPVHGSIRLSINGIANAQRVVIWGLDPEILSPGDGFSPWALVDWFLTPSGQPCQRRIPPSNQSLLLMHLIPASSHANPTIPPHRTQSPRAYPQPRRCANGDDSHASHKHIAFSSSRALYLHLTCSRLKEAPSMQLD